jgi:hypothetical protein
MTARLLAAAAVASAVAGCGSASSSSTEASVPAAALSRAAYVSTSTSGYRANTSVRETVGSVAVSMSGTGSFTPSKHTGELTMRVSAPGALGAAGAGNLPIQAVADGANYYLKLPPAITAQIPGAKPWLKVNLGEVGRLAGIPGLGALANGTSSLNDPRQFLDYLHATAAGTVKALGHQTVDGFETTHYRAEIELSKVADAVSASDRQSAQQLVAALQKNFHAGNLPVNAWIDGNHLVRRVALRYTLQVPGSGQTAEVSTLIDFVAYGPQPAPTLPPAGQTSDLLALLQHG